MEENFIISFLQFLSIRYKWGCDFITSGERPTKWPVVNLKQSNNQFFRIDSIDNWSTHSGYFVAEVKFKTIWNSWNTYPTRSKIHEYFIIGSQIRKNFGSWRSWFYWTCTYADNKERFHKTRIEKHYAIGRENDWCQWNF